MWCAKDFTIEIKMLIVKDETNRTVKRCAIGKDCRRVKLSNKLKNQELLSNYFEWFVANPNNSTSTRNIRSICGGQTFLVNSILQGTDNPVVTYKLNPKGGLVPHFSFTVAGNLTNEIHTHESNEMFRVGSSGTFPSNTLPIGLKLDYDDIIATIENQSVADFK